ncbi:MAG: hypothetical protein H6633_21025 [Anaerolineales bacterium]|nr:hypothetical protein [Anaerolineales bacterium]
MRPVPHVVIPTPAALTAMCWATVRGRRWLEQSAMTAGQIQGTVNHKFQQVRRLVKPSSISRSVR